MTIYVSYTDQSGKERCKQEPNTKYSIGRVFKVNEVWDLFIDNNLESQYISDIKITDIDKEFIVNEETWHITYEVKHFNETEHIKTEYIRESDISEVLNL